MSSTDDGPSLLEVIFSAPIVRDVKKLEVNSNDVGHVDKVTSVCKKISEADQDDRGQF